MTSFDTTDWTAERTPEEWEALAVEFEQASARMYAAREESWQRSDTDGYLSQWALGVSSGGYHAAAALARQRGKVEVSALFNLDGTVASTHFKWGDYGPFWVLNDAAAEAHGRRFVNDSRARRTATRAANMAKKGFTVGTIRVVGRIAAPHAESAVNVHYGAYADVRALRAGDFEVVSTAGGDAGDY